MLAANDILARVMRNTARLHEYLAALRRHILAAARFRSPARKADYLLPNAAAFHSRRFQQLCGSAVGQSRYSEEQMLAPHISMSQLFGGQYRSRHHLPCIIGEFIGHSIAPH